MTSVCPASNGEQARVGRQWALPVVSVTACGDSRPTLQACCDVPVLAAAAHFIDCRLFATDYLPVTLSVAYLECAKGVG